MRFPGKLFLMGEYAIMEKDQPAVIAAVDRFLHVNVENSDEISVESRFGSYQGQSVYSMETMKEVSSALIIAEEYLGFPLGDIAVKIESQLDDGNKKYGFGSSGVVIVAVLKSLLEHHKIQITQLELFKLSVMVQKHMNSYSSGGDLASSIYGGIIQYRRYDFAWLKSQKLSLQEMISIEWPGLFIEDLEFEGYLYIGWTGKSNITGHYLDAVEKARESDPMHYRAFLKSSKIYTLDFIDGIQLKDFKLIKESVEGYRQLMKNLGQWASIEIETNELTHLIDSAKSLGLASKISGSGGGDCGFAISDSPIEEALETVWKQVDIEMIKGRHGKK